MTTTFIAIFGIIILGLVIGGCLLYKNIKQLVEDILDIQKHIKEIEDNIPVEANLDNLIQADVKKKP